MSTGLLHTDRKTQRNIYTDTKLALTAMCIVTTITNLLEAQSAAYAKLSRTKFLHAVFCFCTHFNDHRSSGCWRDLKSIECQKHMLDDAYDLHQ